MFCQIGRSEKENKDGKTAAGVRMERTKITKPKTERKHDADMDVSTSQLQTAAQMCLL